MTTVINSNVPFINTSADTIKRIIYIETILNKCCKFKTFTFKKVVFSDNGKNIIVIIKSRKNSHSSIDNVTALGIDEVQYNKGDKYMTLVYQIDNGCRRFLWIGKDRTKKHLENSLLVCGIRIENSEGILK